jgi:hypothetical protein
MRTLNEILEADNHSVSIIKKSELYVRGYIGYYKMMVFLKNHDQEINDKAEAYANQNPNLNGLRQSQEEVINYYDQIVRNSMTELWAEQPWKDQEEAEMALLIFLKYHNTVVRVASVLIAVVMTLNILNFL